MASQGTRLIEIIPALLIAPAVCWGVSSARCPPYDGLLPGSPCHSAPPEPPPPTYLPAGRSNRLTASHRSSRIPLHCVFTGPFISHQDISPCRSLRTTLSENGILSPPWTKHTTNSQDSLSIHVESYVPGWHIGGEHAMRVSTNLWNIREREGLSQEDIAKQLGYDRTYVGRVERGDREPPWPMMLIAVNIFGPVEVYCEVNGQVYTYIFQQKRHSIPGWMVSPPTTDTNCPPRP